MCSEHDWELLGSCEGCTDDNCCVRCSVCLIEDCYCADAW